LDELLRSRNQSTANPVELLVLSACQTAKGDSRAALGLAGVAVRSGARSTLATLWAVRDQSTAGFMAEFYKQLSQPGVSRAEAVRQAQLALLKQRQYAHPFYWAPFLLVGNWM
jgi:CHAT domain-containing protein